MHEGPLRPGPLPGVISCKSHLRLSLPLFFGTSQKNTNLRCGCTKPGKVKPTRYKSACSRRRKKRRRRRRGGCRRRRKRRRSGCRKRRKRRRRSRCGKRRKRSRCGKRRRRRSKKCYRGGPIMANGYLNFLREYRKCHCGMKPKAIIKRGARAWCALTQKQKDVYNKMGCKVTRSPRRKRSVLCRRRRRRRRC